MTTSGHRSSERDYHALAKCIGPFGRMGLYSNVDLSGLALLLPAVSAPMMWFAGARSVKSRTEEKE